MRAVTLPFAPQKSVLGLHIVVNPILMATQSIERDPCTFYKAPKASPVKIQDILSYNLLALQFI